MNLRHTTILFGVLLLSLWFLGFVVAYKQNAPDERAIVPSLNGTAEPTIDSISISRDDGKATQQLDLTQANDNWTLNTGKRTIRVDNVTVRDIIRQIKDARKDDEVGTSSDLSGTGLDHPSVAVTLKGKSGTNKDKAFEATFNVGKDSADKAYVYVNSSDRPGKAFGVLKSSLSSLFFTDANHLRALKIFEFTDTSAKGLDIKDAASEIDLAKNADNAWRFVKPALGPVDLLGSAATLPKDKDLPKELADLKAPEKSEGIGLKALLDKIGKIQVPSEDDFVAPADTDLNAFGLDAGKESLRIRVTSTSATNGVETLLVGGAVTGKDLVYARMDGDEGVFKLSAKQLEPIRKVLQDPTGLRGRDITDVDASKVDYVSIKAGMGEIKLFHPEGKSWEVQMPDEATTRAASDAALKTLLENLQGKQAIRKFIDSTDPKIDTELGFDHATAEVAIYTESLAKPEAKKDETKKDEGKNDEAKKDDAKKTESDKKEPAQLKKDAKAAVTLLFGKVDGEDVAVKRTLADGTVNRFMVAKTLLEKLRGGEGAVAYLNPAMPLTGEITRIVLTRGKDNVEIDRGQGADAQKWFLKDQGNPQAKNAADLVRANGLMTMLANLQAQKWVKKIDPKEDLSTYGLTEPTLKVVVYGKKNAVSATTAGAAVGMLGSATAPAMLAATTLAASEDANLGEAVTYTFGKEIEQDKEKGVYARASSTDVLFLVSPDLVKSLKEVDLRDRTFVVITQPLIDATLLGQAAALGPQAMLLASPAVSGSILEVDPTKIVDLKLTLRTLQETRAFHFVYQPMEKTWADQSGLLEFNLDADKVKQLTEALGKLTATSIVGLNGPRSDEKLTDKEATLVIDARLDDGKTIKLTIGAMADTGGYFAQSSTWPGAVFTLPSTTVTPWLRGASYFGKERVTAQ